MDKRKISEKCKWFLKKNRGEFGVELSADEARAAEAWFGRCKVLFGKAEEGVKRGMERCGAQYDLLKQEAKAIAGEYFGGADLGIVVSAMNQVMVAAAGGEFRYSGEAGGKEDGVSEDSAKEWVPDDGMEFIMRRYYREVQKYASWDGDEALEKLEESKREFLERYPRDAGLVETAIANGVLAKRAQKEARECGYVGKRGVLEKIIARGKFPPFMAQKIREAYEFGELAVKRVRAAKKLRARKRNSAAPPRCGGNSVAFGDETAKTLPTIAAHCVSFGMTLHDSEFHPNSILSLKPSRKWRIVSDETGSGFGNAEPEGGRGRPAGKCVYVLIPEEANLPELSPGWHAVEKGLGEVLAVCRNLRDSGCGIFGIPASAIPDTGRDKWLSCHMALLETVAHLLPIDGETEVELEIEQRGCYTANANVLLRALLDDVVYRLGCVAPERARQLKIGAVFSGKQDSRHNGYADAAAYAWGCGKGVREAIEAECGWIRACFLPEKTGAAETFIRCLGILRTDAVLRFEDWNALLGGAAGGGGLIGAMAREYGRRAEENPEVWRTYAGYVLRYLDSKAIRLRDLKPQIGWLKEYEPAAESLPPRMRLLWLAIQLAESNHRGGVGFGSRAHREEFSKLTKRLYDEDAPLVCFAELHLAVEHTNRYEFEAARELLKPWGAKDPAVCGLRYHGQVLSSLGQHEAFLGNNEKSLELFDEAIGCFGRLSENAQKEIDHTLAYAVIAAMDSKSPRTGELMARYLYGGEYNEETMLDMARQFAAVGGDEPDSKYAHAILLRYLATLPENDSVRREYLGHKDKWQWCDDGHPWELIAFYRAMMLGGERVDSGEWLKRGYEVAANGDGTLKVIAAVLAAARLETGRISREEYATAADVVEEAVPALGAERAAALRGQTENSMPAIELAKAVLPFIFR